MNGKVRQAFLAHGSADCTEAIRVLTEITAASQEIATLLDTVMTSNSITVGDQVDNAYSNNQITISLKPLKAGAHDRSLGERMADSVIFESLNAWRAADYAVTNQTFEQNRDVAVKGRRVSQIEVEIMVRFISFAQNLPDNLRTMNMQRAMLHQQAAGQAGRPLTEHLLDAPHEQNTLPDDYMGLPTRQIYVYEAIVTATQNKIKIIVLTKLGVPYTESRIAGVNPNLVNGPQKDRIKTLLKELNQWPMDGKKTKRPKYFLAFLDQIANTQAYTEYRQDLNRAGFGFDNAEIVAMAQIQPD
jgi:hypothetical protein